MDFFEYASIAAEIFMVNTLWVQLLVGGLCFAVVFIFEAVALYTIAVREGYKNKWMAFIPFFNTYYIGVCSQKNKIYNINTKTIGLVASIFEFLLVSCYIVYYVACYAVAGYEVAVTTTNAFGLSITTYELVGVPSNLAWAEWIYNNLYKFVLWWLDLLYLLLEISLLICFFQTYACRRYFLFTITSILFPIQGILFFVVRNNRGVNYKEYLRAEQARQYRMYQQNHRQDFDSDPYNRNPYSRNDRGVPPYDAGTQNSSEKSDYDDPFGGLGSSKSDSPFDEFDRKN